MSSFYELSTEFAEISYQLEDPAITPEAFDALMDKLNSVAIDAETKCSNVGGWIKSLDAVQDARRVEIERLHALNAFDKKIQTRLEKLIKLWVKATGQKSIKTNLATFTVRKASTKTEVDISKIWDWPPEIFDAAEKSGALKQEWSVNKPLLKKLPGYEKLPGVTELEGEEGLIIK